MPPSGPRTRPVQSRRELRATQSSRSQRRLPQEQQLEERQAMRARFDFSADFGPRAQALASVDLSGTSVTIDMNSHGMEIDASLTSLLVRDVLRYQYVVPLSLHCSCWE